MTSHSSILYTYTCRIVASTGESATQSCGHRTTHVLAIGQSLSCNNACLAYSAVIGHCDAKQTNSFHRQLLSPLRPFQQDRHCTFSDRPFVQSGSSNQNRGPRPRIVHTLHTNRTDGRFDHLDLCCVGSPPSSRPSRSSSLFVLCVRLFDNASFIIILAFCKS